MSRVAGGWPQAEAGKRLAGTTRSAAYEYLEDIITGDCSRTNAAAPWVVAQFEISSLRQGVVLSLRSILRGADVHFGGNRSDARKILRD
jgi:hypothetical protein